MSKGSLVQLACAVALFAGCSEASDRQEAPGAESANRPADAIQTAEEKPEPGAAGEPQEVTVVARDYAFEVPGPIPAGLTTVRLENRGKATHHMQLYRLGEGKSQTDLVEAIKALPSGGKWPEWAVPAGGPGGISPGGQSNATMALEPGSYALVCWVPDTTGIPHVMKGMVAGAQVAAPSDRAPQPEPRADMTVALVDYDFQFSPALAPGTHTIRVDNRGPQTHEIHFWRLSSGKSMADFMEFLENNERGEPPGRWVGGVSELKAGDDAYIDVAFEEGDYVVVCFVPDEKDRKPHFMHGMAKQIRVS